MILCREKSLDIFLVIIDCYGLKIVVQKKTQRTSKIVVRPNQDSTEVKNDVNGREGMVSVRCLRKAIHGSFLASRGDQVEV